MSKKEKLRSCRVIFLMSAIFILPILFSGYFYFFGKDSLIQNSHHGILITPPLNFNTLHFVEKDGSDYSVESLKRKWGMLYVLPYNCQKDCHDTIHHMRQVQKALGKDFYRIKIILVTHNFKDHLDFLETGTSKQLDDKTIVLLSFQSSTEPKAIDADTLYIIDPLGNIILKYRKNWSMRDLYKDLQRLFNTSQIG